MQTLTLEGQPIRERFRGLYSDQPAITDQAFILTQKSFTLLALMALARVGRHPDADEDGWIHVRDLEPSDNGSRYIYRLRQELLAQLGKIALIDNNRTGRYRLTVEPAGITFRREHLSHFPDYQVGAFFT